MIQLQRHHHLMLVILVLFVVAWFTWTFYLVPRAGMRPDPGAAPPPSSLR